ncbi:MAG: cobyrinate a,c-diamide synthase [Chloroflexota bacterium]
MARTVPGLLVAGVHSGVGKTSVATGLVRALVSLGRRVQPFKVGPDYIDPTYLTRAAGRPCRNLDSWLVGEDRLRELYGRALAEADLAIVEGVMGLFDGHPRGDGAGSSAAAAKLLGLPVLLVIDAARMAQSAAAVAYGFAHLDPDLCVAGIVANNVGSPSHARLVKEAVEGMVGLPVVGCLPRRADLTLSERHLGLVPSDEGHLDLDFFDRLGAHVAEHVDLEAVLRLAEAARPLAAVQTGLWPESTPRVRARIAVARDAAFCFYYQDNLDLLAAYGARLLPFSPLVDASLPEGIDGLYLGGGFPELHAEQLAANHPLLAAVRTAAAAGLPIYAECGGLLYLCQSLADREGREHSMVGLVPARAAMRGRRIALGYAEVRATTDNLLLAAGESARGHEFHWSSLVEPLPPERAAYVLEDGRREGYRHGGLLASYVHLHFASNPALAANLVAACAERRCPRC